MPGLWRRVPGARQQVRPCPRLQERQTRSSSPGQMPTPPFPSLVPEGKEADGDKCGSNHQEDLGGLLKTRDQKNTFHGGEDADRRCNNTVPDEQGNADNG